MQMRREKRVEDQVVCQLLYFLCSKLHQHGCSAGTDRRVDKRNQACKHSGLLKGRLRQTMRAACHALFIPCSASILIVLPAVGRSLINPDSRWPCAGLQAEMRSRVPVHCQCCQTLPRPPRRELASYDTWMLPGRDRAAKPNDATTAQTAS